MIFLQIFFPCLIKPLASAEGSKHDIIVNYNPDELLKNTKKTLIHTPRLLLQQYINKSNDYTIIGCGLRNGIIYVPYCNRKELIFPEKVGLESVVSVIDVPEDNKMQTQRFIQKIGYEGLFSIEFMWSEKDRQYYFIECNLRNDGCNDFVLKSGCNIPYIYYCDAIGCLDHNLLKSKCKNSRYIWEMHHYQSLISKNISVGKWISDLIKSDGFLTYLKDDKKPFYKQFVNLILIKLRLFKHELY